MRVLLVEPDYRHGAASFIAKVTAEGANKKDEETLWYPPLGLMKLATFHKRRGDYVEFAIGRDKSKFNEQPGLFSGNALWDRIYITTLFTFDWDNVTKTIEFYKKAVGGSVHKIFVGGIMASIIPHEVFEETGIQPITGILNSPAKVGLEGDEDIDLLPPDYSLLDPRIYAINNTYYAYTTRGCTRRCPWCGVPDIEPTYQEYIDIKPIIRSLREQYGDKPRLKLMDNNVLASPHLELIVNDLLEIGYGKGQTIIPKEKRGNNKPPLRVIDFNQGLEATHINEKNIKLLEQLNIRPMRIAFDRLSYKKTYVKAISIAQKHGFREFSNYMLYNEKDTPKDLYERLMINIQRNEEWGNMPHKSSDGAIYSYPMRFAPIKDSSPLKQNRSRDYTPEPPKDDYDYLDEAVWVKRFTRNIEIMKGANHGAIPPRADYAKRAIGRNYEEFIANLYMPEELLRNRNDHEEDLSEYGDAPERKRPPKDNKVPEFREFILRLLKKQDAAFKEFHNAVAPCSKEAVKKALPHCKNEEVKEWLQWYLK